MKHNINMYDASSIDQLLWPFHPEVQKVKNYLVTLVKNGASYAMHNATADFRLLHIDDHIIPITICDFVPKNVYLCSVYAQYIDYSIDELSVITHTVFRKLAAMALSLFGKILKQKKIDRCVHVNNWLLPTNIYAPLSSHQIKRITQFLCTHFSTHAILFRTLNNITDSSTIQDLTEQHYRLIGSRLVHLLTFKKNTKKPKALMRDESTLKRSDYLSVDVSTANENDVVRMRDLYQQLYLGKHSNLNPQFTLAFIHFLVNDPLFTIKVLQKDDKIDGLVGCMTRHDITYAPLLGYDTKLPSKLGLYRMLSTMKIYIAIQLETILHSSAGAGDFKRHRGHQSVPEYHAVYTKHLTYGRRMVWSLLRWLVNHIGMTLIKRFDRI